MPGLLGMLGGYYRFLGWSGDIETTYLSLKILMDSNKIIVANFQADYTYPMSLLLCTTTITVFILFLFFRKRVKS
jgi:hypothetical protein